MKLMSWSTQRKIVEFKDFSRPSKDFLVLFTADLILRPFQESPLYSIMYNFLRERSGSVVECLT